MAQCNDCWCKNYSKNNGNCDSCIKNEEIKEKPTIDVILKKRALKQMELDQKDNSKGQSR